MKKIIHMSDLHVGYENLGDRFRTIIRNLIFEKGDKANEYVIVTTGDLVDDANDTMRYDEVKNGFERLEQAGFENILIAPGNHDYGTGSHGDKKFVKIFKQVFFGEEVTFPRENLSERSLLSVWIQWRKSYTGMMNFSPRVKLAKLN